jgi:regulator of protease activity HflC (stomatin/prohibitin superfamily)
MTLIELIFVIIFIMVIASIFKEKVATISAEALFVLRIMKHSYIIIIIYLVYSSFVLIPNKQVGLVYSFGGKYKYLLKNEGINLINPFDSVKIFNLKNTLYDFKVNKYAKDGNLIITYKIQVALNRDEIVRFVNDNTIDTYQLIYSIVAEGTENIISKYLINDIMLNRVEITKEIKDSISNKFNEKDFFVLSDLILSDIDFPNEVEYSLKQRVLANQELEKEMIKTKTIKEQAIQKIEEAKGEAESLRIKNNAISNNSNIIKLEFIKKWDGHLPNAVGGEFVNMIK